MTTCKFKFNNFFFCWILPLDRLICLCMSLSDQITARQSRQKSCFEWPRPFWAIWGRNGNHPRPLSLSPMLNPFFSTTQGSQCILYGFWEGSPLHVFVISNGRESI